MAPASIRYGREIGVMMLVFITGWAYSLVSPILIVVAAIYFMSSWVVWRWQIIYVYVRCYEGGGEIWRTIVACLMYSMLIFTFFMSCVLVSKQAFYQAAIIFVAMPPIIFTAWCASEFHLHVFIAWCASEPHLHRLVRIKFSLHVLKESTSMSGAIRTFFSPLESHYCSSYITALSRTGCVAGAISG
jgi:hypothetical protein